jgi:hypothetical protein
MNASKLEISSRQADASNPSVEAPASNSIRGERPSLVHSRVEVPTKPSPETIDAFVEKVGATSIADIEQLIGDLQTARSFLKSEGERIQQEVSRYSHLSDTASASVKIITEKLGQWRNYGDAGPTATDDRRVEAALHYIEESCA